MLDMLGMVDMKEIDIKTQNNIAFIAFFNAKGNSLPATTLKALANAFDSVSSDAQVKVVVLKSVGEGAFCGGASFDELLAVQDAASGKEFFMGFARLILAMKNCPKFIITRVQGKTVGGGVGIIATSDYVLATSQASIRLSELDLGIGPFVVGPAIERKAGKSALQEMAIDTEWRDALWAKSKGLYAMVFETTKALDEAVNDLSSKLANKSSHAMKHLKSVLWGGTEHWDKLLEERASVSGSLVLGSDAQEIIFRLKNKLGA
jgi:methylglutaconyl-CoA hydratase